MGQRFAIASEIPNLLPSVSGAFKKLLRIGWIERDGESVAHKHQQRLELRGKIHARVEDGIFAEGQGLHLVVADQYQTGFFLHDLPLLKLYGLVIPFGASRLQARALELLYDIFFGATQSSAASFTAFHIVGSQDLDVIPPALTVEVRILLYRWRKCKREKSSQQQEGVAHGGFCP